MNVEAGQILLGVHIALVRRERKPLQRLVMILHHALALHIQQTQVVLRLRNTLLCGGAKPASCGWLILWQPESTVVNQSEIVLRSRIAGSSGYLEPFCRFRVILLDPSPGEIRVPIDLRENLAVFRRPAQPQDGLLHVNLHTKAVRVQ